MRERAPTIKLQSSALLTFDLPTTKKEPPLSHNMTKKEVKNSKPFSYYST